jgi:hypothetical protein
MVLGVIIEVASLTPGSEVVGFTVGRLVVKVGYG